MQVTLLIYTMINEFNHNLDQKDVIRILSLVYVKILPKCNAYSLFNFQIKNNTSIYEIISY